MNRSSSKDFASLLLYDIPLLDVRAPGEFAKGAFPSAVNLPLMTDQERHLVGTCYKAHGQQAAITLGYNLVNKDVMEQRRQDWKRFAESHPQGYLYCFRGGLRSEIVQQQLANAGINYPRVDGGYKALRNFLLEQIQQLSQQADFLIIAGKTGSGKTRIISQFAQSIDLEHLANHRGSSFGSQLSPQPTQINFENSLAIALMKTSFKGQFPILLEDEGKLIGRCALPTEMRELIASKPMVIVQASLDKRIANIIRDYITQPLQDYRNYFGEDRGWNQFSQFILSSLERIKKRLGGLLHQQLAELFRQALYQYRSGKPDSVFSLWVSKLLQQYYDPMYDYQLSKSSRRLLFAGPENQVKKKIKEITY